MSQAFTQNHFELFGIAPAYRLDPSALDAAYREIQSRVHPDRHARAGEAQQRASLQWATRVNEAYATLLDPVRRAAYLLELKGVDCAYETNTAMPAAFLEQQMALREALEEARAAGDTQALDRLQADVRRAMQALQQSIERAIDGARDYAGAAGLVRELRFLERVDEEIGAVFAEMEG